LKAFWVKEANASVLEPMQASAPIPATGSVWWRGCNRPPTCSFGWVTGSENRHFYLRQLRDAKFRALVKTHDPEMLTDLQQGVRLGPGAGPLSNPMSLRQRTPARRDGAHGPIRKP
jgi:hypothetical protein